MSAARGALNPVSAVLLGTNLDEGRLLMPVTMPVRNAPHSSRADLLEWLQTNFGARAAATLAALYADDVAAEGAWAAAANIYTDGQYLCPTQRSARWLSRAGVPRVFTYRLEYAPAIWDTFGQLVYWQNWCARYAQCANATAQQLRVGHGADVALLFNDPRLNASDQQVARIIIDYWAGFFAAGDPNAGSARLPHWPASNRSSNATMRLMGPAPLAQHGALRQRKCAFWDAEHPVPYASSRPNR